MQTWSITNGTILYEERGYDGGKGFVIEQWIKNVKVGCFTNTTKMGM